MFTVFILLVAFGYVMYKIGHGAGKAQASGPPRPLP